VTATVFRQQNRYILYDDARDEQIYPEWFSADYWRDHSALLNINTGRGHAWFIRDDDREYVLRHYCRGGLLAKINHDYYLWSGLSRTRAWREWDLLARMTELGLPVPQPFAAQVVRTGFVYRADLITCRIPQVQPLSECLQEAALNPETWQTIGRTLRRFHEHAVYHADLNAHNILIDNSSQVYVIDFDKGCIAPGNRWKESNLQRLKRSLQKLDAQYVQFYYRESDWQTLIAAYASI
jgi:3-deoxy-D-manno-octulosonic acid kinase